jgi:hypothetical protein
MIIADPLLQIKQGYFRVTIAHVLDLGFLPGHGRDISSITLLQNMLHAISTGDLYRASIGCFRVVSGCLDEVDVSLACTSRENMRGRWMERGSSSIGSEGIELEQGQSLLASRRHRARRQG